LKPALNQALPAMGINWNFPRVVAHRPVRQQGLAIPNLFTKQLISHVTMLAQYGKQGHDITGHLLQANMEAFCLEAGLQGDIFQFPVAILEYRLKHGSQAPGCNANSSM